MKVTNIVNYAAAFISAVLASLVGFDWLTFFSPEQALKIVAALNLVGVMVKAWMTTAEQMARNINAAAALAAQEPKS
jgi:hypothetical protein